MRAASSVVVFRTFVVLVSPPNSHRLCAHNDYAFTHHKGPRLRMRASALQAGSGTHDARSPGLRPQASRENASTHRLRHTQIRPTPESCHGALVRPSATSRANSEHTRRTTTTPGGRNRPPPQPLKAHTFEGNRLDKS